MLKTFKTHSKNDLAEQKPPTKNLPMDPVRFKYKKGKTSKTMMRLFLQNAGDGKT